MKPMPIIWANCACCRNQVEDEAFHAIHCPVWRGHGERENVHRQRSGVREVRDDDRYVLPKLGGDTEVPRPVECGGEAPQAEVEDVETLWGEPGHSVDERPRVHDSVEIDHYGAPSADMTEPMRRYVAKHYHEGGYNPGDEKPFGDQYPGERLKTLPLVALEINCPHCGSRWSVPLGIQ